MQMTKKTKIGGVVMIKSTLRVVLLTVVGVVVIGGLVLWSFTTSRRTDVSTRVDRK